MAGQHLVDDLAHPVVGALLEALDQRHHRHPRPQLLGQLGRARRGSRATARPSRRRRRSRRPRRSRWWRAAWATARPRRRGTRVAVILVDVVGGLLGAHPLQRRPAPGADGRHGGAPGASTEDDDFGFALRRCHADQRMTVGELRGPVCGERIWVDGVSEGERRGNRRYSTTGPGERAWLADPDREAHHQHHEARRRRRARSRDHARRPNWSSRSPSRRTPMPKCRSRCPSSWTENQCSPWR